MQTDKNDHGTYVVLPLHYITHGMGVMSGIEPALTAPIAKYPCSTMPFVFVNFSRYGVNGAGTMK